MRLWAGLGLALLAGCQAVLRDGLSDAQAAQLTAALDEAGIVSTRERRGARGIAVTVAQGDVPGALRALERTASLRSESSGFNELLGEPGLLMTPREERARWAAAMSGELARSLQRLPGVVDARVHIALPEVPFALDRPQPPAKASVLLRRDPDTAPVDEADVRALVAGAVEGLARDQVVVVQSRAPGPRASAPKLVRVGPIEVTRRSAPALRGVLGAALALDLLLAIALIAVVYRRRQRIAGAHSGALLEGDAKVGAARR